MLGADQAVLSTRVNWPRTASTVRDFVGQAMSAWESANYGNAATAETSVSEAAAEVQASPEFSASAVQAQVEAGVRAGAPYPSEAAARQVGDKVVRDVAGRFGRKMSDRAKRKMARAQAEGAVVPGSSAMPVRGRRVSHDPSIILHPGYVSAQADPTARLIIEVADRGGNVLESEIETAGLTGMGFAWGALLTPIAQAAGGVGTALLQKKAAEDAAKAAKKAAAKAAEQALKLAREQRAAQVAAARTAASQAAAAAGQRPPAVPGWAWALGAGGLLLLGSGLFLRGRQRRVGQG